MLNLFISNIDDKLCKINVNVRVDLLIVNLKGIVCCWIWGRIRLLYWLIVFENFWNDVLIFLGCRLFIKVWWLVFLLYFLMILNIFSFGKRYCSELFNVKKDLVIFRNV